MSWFNFPSEFWHLEELSLNETCHQQDLQPALQRHLSLCRDYDCTSPLLPSLLVPFHHGSRLVQGVLVGKLGKRARHCDILSTILHIPSPQWGYLSMNQPTSGEKRVYEIGSGAKVIKPQDALLIAARPDGTSANFLGNCEWAVQKFMVGFQGAAIKLRKANHRLELR